MNRIEGLVLLRIILMERSEPGSETFSGRQTVTVYSESRSPYSKSFKTHQNSKNTSTQLYIKTFPETSAYACIMRRNRWKRDETSETCASARILDIMQTYEALRDIIVKNEICVHVERREMKHARYLGHCPIKKQRQLFSTQKPAIYRELFEDFFRTS